MKPEITEEETKLERPVEIMKEHDSDDEEDEDDFKVKYRSPADDYSDLTKLQKKPLFISDLLQGLRSEDFDRFSLALKNSEALIRSQKSNDLDLLCQELLETIFRTQN